MRSRPILSLMFVLGMLAALAATPLRLAEAASDQARTLSELDGSAEIEPIDGGVGDDSGATTRSQTLVDCQPICAVVVWGEIILVENDRIPVGLARTTTVSPPERAEDVPRRLALLQRFLL